MDVYPIFLNRLNKNKTVIIGGDDEAERKVGELNNAGADLIVISRRISPVMHEWHGQNVFEWISRDYQEGDLKGAFMVIVAEFTGDTNQLVWKEANRLGILCNVMDDIPHCNFTFGSLVKRGPLNIAVSTSGAAPTLAVRLRERFEQEFGPEYEDFLDFMHSIRGKMKQLHPDFSKRKQLWYELIDSNVLDLFRQGRFEEAEKLTYAIISGELINPHTPKPSQINRQEK
ncbi:MAG: bifunctional precorrin-2 dehydrogenase/sirohydrochlorin ferrochelatase [Balneolales bacterium]